MAESPGMMSAPAVRWRKRHLRVVQPQVGHPLLVIGAVACEAVVGEDGAHFAIEVYSGPRRGESQRSGKNTSVRRRCHASHHVVKFAGRCRTP